MKYSFFTLPFLSCPLRPKNNCMARASSSSRLNPFQYDQDAGTNGLLCVRTWEFRWPLLDATDHRLHRAYELARGEPDGGGEVPGHGLQTRPRASYSSISQT